MSKKNINKITENKFCTVKHIINSMEDPLVKQYNPLFLSIINNIENEKNQKSIVTSLIMFCGVMLTSDELEVTIDSLKNLLPVHKLDEAFSRLTSGELSISESIETILEMERIKKENK